MAARLASLASVGGELSFSREQDGRTRIRVDVGTVYAADQFGPRDTFVEVVSRTIETALDSFREDRTA